MPACLGFGSVRAVIALHCLGPNALLLLLLLCCVARRLLAPSPPGAHGRRGFHCRDRLGASLKGGALDAAPWALLLAFLSSPAAYLQGFRALQCEPFGADVGDPTDLLVADYSIECSPEDAEYEKLLLWAWATIALYAIFLPCLFGALLLCARRTIARDDPTPLAKSLRFLYSDYKRKCFWWELMEIGRKATLIGFYVLIGRGTFAQLFAGFFTQFCFLYLQSVARPYSQATDNVLALTCSFASTAHFAFCIFLKVADVRKALDQDLSHLSDEMVDVLDLDVSLAASILAALIGSCLLLAAALELIAFFDEARRAVEEANQRQRTLHAQGRMKHPPNGDWKLGEGNQYCAFLSHYKVR